MTAKILIDALSVIEEDILAEAAKMAIWFSHAARYRVDKMRIRCRREAALDECAASLNITFRREANRESERKTEAYFKARITLSPRHQRLLRRKEAAEHREELAKLILDAYRMRRDAIKIIADHQSYGAMTGERMIEKRNQERLLANRARGLDKKRRRVG